MRILRYASLSIAAIIFTACTASKPPEATEHSSLVAAPGEVVIEKNQGLNVGESEAIWVVGLKPVDRTVTPPRMTVKIHRISMDPLKNYPKQTWNLNPTNPDVVDSGGEGSRTQVTEWGLLVGRGGKTAGLYLIDPNQGVLPPVIEAGDSITDGRATPISYLIKRGGKVYKYIGIAYQKNSGSNVFRIERFLRDDASNSFKRVAPYEFTAPQMPGSYGVYKGATVPCSIFDGETCTPIFYGGGVGNSQSVFGVKLDTDANPPTLCPLGTCTTVKTPVQVMPPNDAFVSTSHPKSNAGPWGSINNTIYSFAGDPDTGDLFKADSDDANTFVSYDRINEVVFRVTRGSALKSDGTKCTPFPACAHSVVTVFKKECFKSQPDCSPTTTNRSRIFTDVGKSLGPTSDLQNGCVALLSFARPGEPGGADWVTDVYKACIRDPADLNKGLSVMKIAEAEGAAYMYNDFTGATLGDRPQYVLYDFSAKGLTGFKTARFEWAPKPGFTNTATGVNNGVRCYSKGQTPPPFTNIDFGNAFSLITIPNCGGANINMVEFEMKIVPKTRFTRYQSISVRVTK
jgi:hypothetical protein